MKADAEPRQVVSSPEQQELLIRLLYDRADAALVNEAAARAIDTAISMLGSTASELPIETRPLDNRVSLRLH